MFIPEKVNKNKILLSNFMKIVHLFFLWVIIFLHSLDKQADIFFYMTSLKKSRLSHQYS